MSASGDRERDEARRLRAFFAAVHADDRVPLFARLTRPRRRPPLWRPAIAVVAVLVAAIALVWLTPRLVGPGTGGLTEEEQLALARELSGWRGPLDFLLETPGRELLLAPPSLELTTLRIPPPALEEEEQP